MKRFAIKLLYYTVRIFNSDFLTSLVNSRIFEEQPDHEWVISLNFTGYGNKLLSKCF